MLNAWEERAEIKIVTCDFYELNLDPATMAECENHGKHEKCRYGTGLRVNNAYLPPLPAVNHGSLFAVLVLRRYQKEKPS